MARAFVLYVESKTPKSGWRRWCKALDQADGERLVVGLEKNMPARDWRVAKYIREEPKT